MTRKRIGLCTVYTIVLVVGFSLLPIAGSRAEAASLTTIFAADNSYAGNMFDVTVLSEKNLVIDAFDINIESSNPAESVTVYFRHGSYVDHETDPNAWIRAGSTTVTPQAINQPTHVPIGGIRLLAGETYGIYISFAYSGTAVMVYTNGSGIYQDSNLKITCGVGMGWPEFSSVFTPRIWNGTIHYSEYAEPQTGDLFGSYVGLYVSLAAVSGGMISWLGINRMRKRMVKLKSISYLWGLYSGARQGVLRKEQRRR